jgi:prevent-host-death family protein
MSKTIAATEFEAHSLALLEEVAENQEELVIVDHGKPLVKVVPIAPVGDAETRRPRTREELLGSVTTLGDIVEPLDDEWDAMK